MVELTADEKARNAAIKACGCMCHQPGVEARHVMACCKYSCQKPSVPGPGVKKNKEK